LVYLMAAGTAGAGFGPCSSTREAQISSITPRGITYASS
jgi:hypothetical protein